MNLMDWITLVASLGLGGALGAIAALLSAAARLFQAFDAFRTSFQAFLKANPDQTTLKSAFEELDHARPALLTRVFADDWYHASVAIPRHPEQAGTKLVTGGGLPNPERSDSAHFYC